jgi:acyl-CoA oxidase
MVARFISKIEGNIDPSLDGILHRVLFLSSLYFLDKHLVTFYQGGYFSNERAVLLVRETLLELCAEIKDESMGLVDAMAGPDFALNSPIGASTGDAYKNVYSMMMQSAESKEPIKFLDEFLLKTKYASLKSNL